MKREASEASLFSIAVICRAGLGARLAAGLGARLAAGLGAPASIPLLLPGRKARHRVIGLTPVLGITMAGRLATLDQDWLAAYHQAEGSDKSADHLGPDE